uniref:BTB domain-containing protein n=1 Tax=Leersia perrieri TaxID=77586 RepID=A0A0D9VRM6_9ORYZ
MRPPVRAKPTTTSPTATAAAHDAATSSASNIVAGGAMRRYHAASMKINIANYSLAKAHVPNSKRIDTPTIRARGHTCWHVGVFLNGRDAEDADYVSFLYLDGVAPAAEEKTVYAQAVFSLLDIEGNPVPSYTNTTVLVNFSEEWMWGYKQFIKRETLENRQYLKDDCFSVRIHVFVMKADGKVPPSNLHQHFGDLLLSKVGADVKFQVGEKEFDARRLVLAARSPVFKAELFGRMRESTNKSAIKIDDMEEEVFEAMLTFIYTDALPETKQLDEVTMIQHLFVAADRYDLERLKLICERSLYKHIETGSVADILVLAEQHCCHQLKEACLEFLRTSSSLDEVMETDGFGYILNNCPGLVKELLSKRFPCKLG